MMYKLWATIQKDFRILFRDKVGLIFMFAMPVLLAIIITAVQNSTFELVNKNKVPLLFYNRDAGDAGKQLQSVIEKIGMFQLVANGDEHTEEAINDRMHNKDALVAIIVPPDFSEKVKAKANNIAAKAIKDFELNKDSLKQANDVFNPLIIYYHPVLQETFRRSVQGAVRSSLQLVESKQILSTLYFSLNNKELPQPLEDEIVKNEVPLKEISVSRNGSRTVPNATEHNIPAWTIFAMFFVVVSLGGSVVREKTSGSFTRLKTLPTSYAVALFSKQFTYVAVTFVQALVIFSIGHWLFPTLGLPVLHMPSDLPGLLIVILVCGFCASSYAVCLGVYAQTPEQVNGFGAISIIILAALGGLLVPAFAMPASFRIAMQLSPLHWCLEAFYGLFLEGGKLKDILVNIIPLLAIIIVLQLLTFAGLKRKNLI